MYTPVSERDGKLCSRIWSQFRESGISHRIQENYTKQFNSELCMDTEHEVKQSSKTSSFEEVVPQSF